MFVHRDGSGKYRSRNKWTDWYTDLRREETWMTQRRQRIGQQRIDLLWRNELEYDMTRSRISRMHIGGDL